MIYFYLIITFIICQRLVELYIAHKNEKWMLARGGIEVGNEHYKLFILLHVTFFIFLIYEVHNIVTAQSVAFNIYFFFLFVIAQIMRVWCIVSLGKFWNTKIIVLPGAKVVRKGPYRYFRHPNYVIVIMEMMTLPLIFHAYWTAIIFMLSCAVVLFIRIREEEAALKEATNYEAVFFNKSIRDERKWT